MSDTELPACRITASSPAVIAGSATCLVTAHDSEGLAAVGVAFFAHGVIRPETADVVNPTWMTGAMGWTQRPRNSKALSRVTRSMV
jgi:hypothetical protein